MFGPELPLIHHHTITIIEQKGTKFRRYHQPDLPVSCRRLELKEIIGIPKTKNVIGYGILMKTRNIIDSHPFMIAPIMQVKNTA